MVGPAGPPATINREPGQAWKGAAAAVTLCAGVWLVGFTSITIAFSLLISFFLPLTSSRCRAISVAWPIRVFVALQSLRVRAALGWLPAVFISHSIFKQRA